MTRHLMLAVCLAAVALPVGVAYAATNVPDSGPSLPAGGPVVVGITTSPGAPAELRPRTTPSVTLPARANAAEPRQTAVVRTSPALDDEPCWGDRNPDAAATAGGRSADDRATVTPCDERDAAAVEPAASTRSSLTD